MFLKNSRYTGVPPFEADPDGRTAFRGVRPRPIRPTAGIIEHTEGEDDRPDHLAADYYRADRSWWRIVDANPEFLIAGPVRDADGKLIAGGDGISPEAATGDVMISKAMEGDAVLIPPAKG